MKLELYYRMLKHDPDGNLVKDTGMLPGGSYVIQFLEMLQALFDGINKVATNVDGGESTIIYASYSMFNYVRVKAAALDDAYGIVVGTNAGTTAEDNLNYALDTKILHSSAGAADKLNYRDMITTAPAVDGANVDFDMARPFINETDATITVKEIGLICKNQVDTKYHLLLRDVVTDEDVEAGYTLTVVYTLRTTA